MQISFQNQQVTVFESELMCTTCTLIEQADHLLLVDPNWLPREVNFIAEYVDKVRATRPLYLLFTHSDYDHIIAYEKFRDQASLIISQAFLDNPDQEAQLQEIRKFYDQYYLSPPWPVTYPSSADLVIAARQEAHQIGKTHYQFYQAPGHNPDGLLTFLPESGILIVGDYLCEVEFPFIYHSIGAYQQTLNVLKELLHNEAINLLVAGHGPVCTEPEEMLERLREAQWYLDHLIAYGSTGTPFPEEELWLRYAKFPMIQKKYHRENLALAVEELRK